MSQRPASVTNFLFLRFDSVVSRWRLHRRGMGRARSAMSLRATPFGGHEAKLVFVPEVVLAEALAVVLSGLHGASPTEVCTGSRAVRRLL